MTVHTYMRTYTYHELPFSACHGNDLAFYKSGRLKTFASTITVVTRY